MIRDSKRVRVSLFVLLFIVLASSSVPVAHAGDADGVQGYSMRLKNKDFTTDPPGGSGLAVAIPPIVKTGLQEPQLTGGSGRITRISLTAVFDLSWKWLILGAR